MNEEQLRRLSDCEVLLNKYHQEIQNYRKQCTNYSEQIISKDEFLVYSKDLLNKLKQDLSQVSKSIENCVENLSKLEQKVDVSSHQIANLSKTAQDHENKLIKVISSKESFQFLISAVEKRMSLIESKMFSKEKANFELQEVKTSFSALFSTLQKDQDDLRRSIQKEENSSRLMQNNYEMLNQKHQKSEEKAKKDLDVLDKKIKEFELKIQEDRRNLDLFVDQKLAKLPKPEVKLPDFAPQLSMIKSEIAQSVHEKFQNLGDSIDLSKLNEIQMKVLDKKLENIFSILQKNGIK